MNEDGWTVDTSVEIVEVYNETFRDLLNPSSAIEGTKGVDSHRSLVRRCHAFGFLYRRLSY